MSRARHHTKEHHGKKHHADGGVAGQAKMGNPNVFRLAEGKEPAHLHGEGGKGHLGLAKGGKIKAHKRADGGAMKGNYSSAKLEKGGMSEDYKPLHHKAEGHPDGVHHNRAHGGHVKHHEGHKAKHHEGHHEKHHEGHHRGRHRA